MNQPQMVRLFLGLHVALSDNVYVCVCVWYTFLP